MKDAYYFSHDANARNDEKILELRSVYDWRGYGIYWAIIESFRDAPNYRLNRGLIGGLSAGLGIPKDELIAIIDFCIQIGLFAADDTSYWSESLLRRMEDKDAKKAALSDAGKRGAAKRWGGHDDATGHPIAKKGKERKRKYTPSNPPTGELLEQAKQVYAEYPRREGGADAIARIANAITEHGADFIAERVRQFAAAVATWPAEKQGDLIPMPATWFNQKRFIDDPAMWMRRRANAIPHRRGGV